MKLSKMFNEIKAHDQYSFFDAITSEGPCWFDKIKEYELILDALLKKYKGRKLEKYLLGLDTKLQDACRDVFEIQERKK